MEMSQTIQPFLDALSARLKSDDSDLTAAIDLAVLVATADGKIDKVELAVLAASVERLVGSRLDPAVVRHLIRESRTQIEATGSEVRAKAIGEFLAAHDAVDEGLRLAIAIGCVSEGLSPPERERIASIAKAAGVPVERIDAIAAEIQPPGSR
jgi:tellurite resistance protein